MRGKKIDTNFVAEFVTTCVKEGKVSSETISADAYKKIAEIDLQIKAVDELKKLRSKLYDVIISFDEKSVKDKSEDKIILDFYSVEDKKLASEIINSIEKNNQFVFTFPIPKEISDPDGMIFCIKQMSRLKIISPQEKGIFLRGVNYQAYVDFFNKVYNIRPMNEHGFIKYGTDN